MVGHHAAPVSGPAAEVVMRHGTCQYAEPIFTSGTLAHEDTLRHPYMLFYDHMAKNTARAAEDES